MAIEMKTQCEKCGKPLLMDSPAYICSYECTFCEDCAKSINLVCPNCKGELVVRPKRIASK